MIVGLDLGSTRMGVCVNGRVWREPATVAMEARTRKVLAVGEPAHDMQGRTTSAIAVLRPVQEGVAAVPDLLEALVRHLLRQSLGWRRWLRPTVAVSIPITFTAVEREAVQQAVLGAGAGKTRLIPVPLAAGWGAGEKPSDMQGRMIVDIGAAQTQAALVCMGAMMAAEAVPFGGDAMTVAIVRHLRDMVGRVVSAEQAEALKMDIGGAVRDDTPVEATVIGRDVQTGLPHPCRVSSETIRLALVEPLQQISGVVRRVLARTPPELASDVLDRGILLTGGGARLRGLAEYLQADTRIPVQVAPDAEKCVVLGTGGAS